MSQTGAKQLGRSGATGKPIGRRYENPVSRPRWTRPQKLVLLEGAGSFATRTVERRTGRTRKALEAVIRRHFDGGGLSRGSFTLREAQRETGYHRTQLRRAQRALGQAWMRTSSKGRWLISVEQLEALTKWLATDYWSAQLRLTECLRHRGRERPHHRSGLCSPCYWAVRGAAERLGLRFSVEAMLEQVATVVPFAAPSDAVRLGEYQAQLSRRLVLLEPELGHLARIAHLARMVAGAAPISARGAPPAAR